MSDEETTSTDEPQGPIDLPAPPIPEEYQRRQPEVGNVLYAWQMQVDGGWNIIGMAVPGGGHLPLVTTSMPLAWEAFEVAQAHANRGACQVRLAAFRFDTVAAIVDPND